MINNDESRLTKVEAVCILFSLVAFKGYIPRYLYRFVSASCVIVRQFSSSFSWTSLSWNPYSVDKIEYFSAENGFSSHLGAAASSQQCTYFFGRLKYIGKYISVTRVILTLDHDCLVELQVYLLIHPLLHRVEWTQQLPLLWNIFFCFVVD
jgi:hypothetical protein